jgi:aquaporin Z
MVRKLGAEFVGTFVLVFAGCGTAVLASGGEKNIGVGWLGVAIAFGLTVVVGAYALGAISGAHFNPAVTFGLWAGKRFEAKHILPYVVTQVVAAIIAAGVLLLIARDGQGFSLAGGFASNGYGEHSPGGYGIVAAIIAEFVLSFIFIFVIMGATDERAPKGFAPLAIGLCLTLVHLVGIPVTNMSVNPARSIGPAVFVGGWAIQQLWLFILIPIAGGLAAGVVHRVLLGESPQAQSDSVGH